MKYSESKTAFVQEINYEIAGTHFLRTVFFYKEFCRSESVSSLHLLWLFAVRSSRSCLFSAPLSMNAVASTHIILWCVQVFVVYLLAIWNLEFGNGLPFLLETYPSIIKKERLGFLPWKACFQLKKKKSIKFVMVWSFHKDSIKFKLSLCNSKHDLPQFIFFGIPFCPNSVILVRNFEKKLQYFKTHIFI